MADPSLTKPKIAPYAIVTTAAVVTWRGLDTVLRLGWVAALLSMITGILLEPPPPQLSADATSLELAPGAVVMLLVLGVVTGVLQAVVAVAWHRALLLGDDGGGKRYYLRLGSRELVYALICFLLVAFTAMAGLVMLPTAFDQLGQGHAALGLVFLGGPVVAIVILARTVLILPAVALGRPADLATAWQAVDGNTGRVVAVLLMAGASVGVIGVILVWVFASVHQRHLGLLVDGTAMFVNALVTFVLMAFVLSVLSLLYALLVDDSLRRHLPGGGAGLIER